MTRRGVCSDDAVVGSNGDEARCSVLRIGEKGDLSYSHLPSISMRILTESATAISEDCDGTLLFGDVLPQVNPVAIFIVLLHGR